jgi:nucleoside-diphosphate-sugar epimerase
MNTLRGKRILVTGATGFIGNRLVERLILEQGAEVVALVHQFRNASRLARFPLRMIGGDVTDGACVRKAAEGCDALVHTAVTFSGTSKDNRRVTVEGARNVCQAAKIVGARLVHFSTFSVYGQTAPGPLNENARKRPGNDAYGASKLEAERLVQQYQQQGLPATILQPTIVYGPWSFWSTHTAGQLMQGDVVLPEGGEGLCNAVYVDDVIDATLLCLQNDSVAAGPFLISAAKPVTWRDYYLAHAAALPGSAVDDMKNEEIAALMRKASTQRKGLLAANALFHLKCYLGDIPGLRKTYRVIKRLVPPSPAVPGNLNGTGQNECTVARLQVLPVAEQLPLLRSQTSVQIQRAQTGLGYEPKFDLVRGGAITAEWLRWAGFAATEMK